MLGLVPIRNWGHIDKTIYRSAQPRYKYEWEWLKNTAKIDVVVNLREECDLDEVIRDRYGFPFWVTKIGVKDHQPPTNVQANYFTTIIKDVEKWKMNTLIHCRGGQGRTSTFSVLAKVALGWDVEKAIEDERKRFHYSFKHKAQEEWLRRFLSENKI